MKFVIDFQDSKVIIAFRTYNNINRKPYQSIIVWYKFGDAIYNIKSDFNNVKIYFIRGNHYE